MPRAATTSIDPSFVFWLSFAQLIGWGSVFYGFSLFMAPVEAALGLTRAASSLAFSLALLMEGLAAFAVGRWIDRGHERRVMTGGSLLVGLAFVAHAWIDRPWQFYAVWSALGLGLSATLYPPAFAVLTRRFPNDFRRAIIQLTFLGGLASTVFIPLVAWLMDALGWRDALLVLGAMHLLLCAPLHHYLLRDAPTLRRTHGTTHEAQEAHDVHNAHGAHGAQATREMHDEQAGHTSSLRVHLRAPTFWLLAAFVILLMAVTAALPAHLVSLLRESGLAERWVLAIPAAVGVLQVVGRSLLYLLERHIDVHRVNRWVPCLIPLGFAVLWLAGTHGLGVLLFVLLFGMGNGMFTIVKGTVVAQYISQHHVGSLNGVIGLPMALARAAAPWVMGLMWQPAGGYANGLLLMTVLAGVGVAMLWRVQTQVLAH